MKRSASLGLVLILLTAVTFILGACNITGGSSTVTTATPTTAAPTTTAPVTTTAEITTAPPVTTASPVTTAPSVTHAVTFLDYNGEVLSTQTVEHGESAIAPRDPVLEGYRFTGWDRAFTNVTADLTVTATYEINTYTVTFLMPDGSPVMRYSCAVCDLLLERSQLLEGACPLCGGSLTTVAATQTVEHGFPSTPPEPPEYYFVENEEMNAIFAFSGWNAKTTEIKADTTLTAVYERPVYVPVITVKLTDPSQGKVDLYVQSGQGLELNCLELTLSYASSKNPVINAVSINRASALYREESEANGGNQYVVNNKTKTFSFVWMHDTGAGQSLVGDHVMTLSFGVSAGRLRQGEVAVSACNAIVTPIKTEANPTPSPEQITPIVIYQ